MLLNHRSDSVVPIRTSGNFLLSYSCYRDAEIGFTLHPFKMYGECVRLELKGHIWFSTKDVRMVLTKLCFRITGFCCNCDFF